MSRPTAVPKETLFRTFAALFVGAAIYHAVHVVVPEGGTSSPAWRHALFVVINLVVAAGLLSRPRVFGAAFALLTLQQLHGHGGMAWELWRMHQQVDWLSVGIVVVLPVIFVLLVLDARQTI